MEIPARTEHAARIDKREESAALKDGGTDDPNVVWVEKHVRYVPCHNQCLEGGKPCLEFRERFSDSDVRAALIVEELLNVVLDYGAILTVCRLKARRVKRRATVDEWALLSQLCCKTFGFLDSLKI